MQNTVATGQPLNTNGLWYVPFGTQERFQRPSQGSVDISPAADVPGSSRHPISESDLRHRAAGVGLNRNGQRSYDTVARPGWLGGVGSSLSRKGFSSPSRDGREDTRPVDQQPPGFATAPMPSATFIESVQIDSAPGDVWDRLQVPSIWASVGSVHQVWDSTIDDGALRNFKLPTNIGGKVYEGVGTALGRDRPQPVRARPRCWRDGRKDQHRPHRRQPGWPERTCLDVERRSAADSGSCACVARL